MRKLSDIKINLNDFYEEVLKELMQKRVGIKLKGKELNKENMEQAIDEVIAEAELENQANMREHGLTIVDEADMKKENKQIRKE